MKNDTAQNNFEPRKSASPEGHDIDQSTIKSGSGTNQMFDNLAEEKGQTHAGIKKLDVVMLDSESIISPVTAAEEPHKTSKKTPNSTVESSREKTRIGSLLQGQKQLFLGLLIGFLLGSLLLAAFLLNRSQDDETKQKTTSDIPKVATTIETEPLSDEEADFDGKPQNNQVTINELKPVENNPRRSPEKAPADKSETRKNDLVKEQTSEHQEEVPKSLNPADQTELNTSLNGLIKATNDRNFDQQMNYYAPQVKSYYRARNASSRQIRNEKQKVFGDTEWVDVQASQPQISLERDGRTATMLFRKKYSIKKGQENRNGEVLQELKWVKSKKGWKIVSERDVKVLNR